MIYYRLRRRFHFDAGLWTGVAFIALLIAMTSGCNKTEPPSNEPQASNANAPTAPPPSAPAGSAATLKTTSFKSASMSRALNYNILLPAGFDANKTGTYPVLFLLHGLEGHFDDWASLGNVEATAAKYPFIIVMPEGGDGWYSDSTTLPDSRFESYIGDLMLDVQRSYPSIDRRHMMIAGLSMGGYGALKAMLKSAPNTFWLVGSFSGAFGIDRWTGNNPNAVIGKSVDEVFGPVDSPMRQKNDIYGLVRTLPTTSLRSIPHLYLSCGEQDAAMLKVNEDFVKTLEGRGLQAGQNFEYHTSPGGHEWKFWSQQIAAFLELASQRLAEKR